MIRRRSEAAERFAERRRREDEAPRLRDMVPILASLRLEIEERRGTSTVAETRHVRHIVANAPALFVLPCGDSSCSDGGHEITQSILRGLLAGEERFEVVDGCNGRVGSANCGRVLHVTAVAAYGDAPPSR